MSELITPQLPSAFQAETEPGGFKKQKLISSIIIHTILILVAVGMVFPLVWMLASSFKAPQQQITWPPQFIPQPFYTKNFINLFALAPMGTYLLNSVKIAVVNVIGICFSSSLAAFAFARLRFRGRNAIFAVLLATMMIPGATTIIPTFVIFRNLGWIDTHYPLIVPSFFGSAYMVFLLRQAYLAIPQDLMDAAEIDGAGFFYIYLKIFLPLGMPILTTVAMLVFLWNWNDLFGPLIFLSTQMKMTVQLGLAYLRGRSGTGVERYGVVMAGSLMGVLPMLLLYALGQKYFVQGLTRTGIKG
jgi:ABC-type glycerol-3-phosphate transport system permease component